MAATFPLHAAVLRGEDAALEVLLAEDASAVDAVDMHGNSALHLAVMLSEAECVRVLLRYNASAKTRNCQAWNPLDEAISIGNREIMAQVLKRRKAEAESTFVNKAPRLLRQVEELPDFSIHMSWEFHTWIPLVSRFLPNDTWVIRKCGRNLRVDSTLKDFAGLSWVRGSVSYLFFAEENGKISLAAVDNDEREYELMHTPGIGGTKKPDNAQEEDPEFLELELDNMMSSDISNTFVNEDAMEFVKAQSGFPGWRYDKTEVVNGYDTVVFNAKGAAIKTLKRREHLRPEDIRKNQEMKNALKENTGDVFKNMLMAQSDPSDAEGGETMAIAAVPTEPVVHRVSLEKPARPENATVDKYFSQVPNPKDPSTWHLGRKMVLDESSTSIKATLNMAENFPVSITDILPLLEILANSQRHAERLRQFLQSGLPPGFPVKIDIPLIATIHAKITFSNFSDEPSDASLFKIPDHFTRVITQKH